MKTFPSYRPPKVATAPQKWHKRWPLTLVTAFATFRERRSKFVAFQFESVIMFWKEKQVPN
jgi:hypothetical protein